MWGHRPQAENESYSQEDKNILNLNTKAKQILKLINTIRRFTGPLPC